MLIPIIIIVLIIIIILITIIIAIVPVKNRNPTKSINELHKHLYQIIESKSHAIDLQSKIYYPIYYINMDTNTERRNFIEQQMKKYCIYNYKRIPGIVADDLKYKFETDYDLSKIQIGCITGHIMVMIEFLKSDGECIFVLEDDASLALIPHLNFDFKAFIETKIPNDWEIVSLCNFFCNHHGENGEYCKYISLYERIKEQESCWSTAAYIINRKAAKKFLDIVLNNDTISIKYTKSDFPKYGVADNYIYALLKTYYISPSVIFPYNPEVLTNNDDEYFMKQYIKHGTPILNDGLFSIKQI